MNQEKESKVKEDLRLVINRNSLENESNTPDYILAELLFQCLESYNSCVKNRDKWFGVDIWKAVKQPS